MTIPSEIREILNAEQGDQLRFSVNEHQQIIIQSVKKDSLLSLFGSMPARGESQQKSWKDIRKLARDEKGDQLGKEE